MFFDFNIVDLVKDQIGSELRHQMGNMLDSESSYASAAIDGAVPALLDGLRDKSATEAAAQSLYKAVQDHDDGLLDRMGSLLNGGYGNTVIDNGSALLRNLVGNDGQETMGSAISATSGLSKSGTGSLLGMIAPVVIGVLKKKVVGGGLNAAGLAYMLRSQKDNIDISMPSGLSNQLNSSGFSSVLRVAAVVLVWLLPVQ